MIKKTERMYCVIRIKPTNVGDSRIIDVFPTYGEAEEFYNKQLGEFLDEVRVDNDLSEADYAAFCKECFDYDSVLDGYDEGARDPEGEFTILLTACEFHKEGK